jgi:hypothetical protein
LERGVLRGSAMMGNNGVGPSVIRIFVGRSSGGRLCMAGMGKVARGALWEDISYHNRGRGDIFIGLHWRGKRGRLASEGASGMALRRDFARVSLRLLSL